MSDRIDSPTHRPKSGPLASWYDAIALPPDRQYGIDPGPGNDRGFAFNQWPPFTTNRIGSGSWVAERGANPQWSVPQIVREGLKAWLDLAQATDTGTLTPQALSIFMADSLGTGAAFAPAGVLAAGGRRLPRGPGSVSDLAMDETSRFRRARAMGFDPDMKLYQATHGPDFQEFGSGLGAPQSGGVPLSGIWAAENPACTDALARASGNMGDSSLRLMPLFARKDRVASVKLAGDETPMDIYGAIKGPWHDGYDALRVPNYYTLPDGSPTPTWFFRDPNQLRSWFARFDPAKRDSSDLLAARATPGFNITPPSEPGFRVKAGRSAAEMEF